MVNKSGCRNLAHSPEQPRRLVTGGCEPSLARNIKLDGTKLPIVLQPSQDHKGMYKQLFPGRSIQSDLHRNTLVMLIFWAALRTVGDKIELTVTIVAREHHHHGR